MGESARLSGAVVDFDALVAGDFRPERSALLIVDVQNDFCASGGYFGRIGARLDMIHAAVDRLKALLPAARAAGVLPVFIRTIYDEPFVSAAMRARPAEFPPDLCLSNAWGSELFELALEPSDLVVTKHRFSGFIGTDLSSILESRGITSLILTGVATNVCVESTARDGFMLDYHVMMLSDCSAADDLRMHEASLENIDRWFGVVGSSTELSAAWQRLGAGARE